MSKALRKALMVRMFLNPTVRLIKFGMMYNARTDSVLKLNDVNHNPILQSEVMQERDYLFYLKHKPPSYTKISEVSSFVKKCLGSTMLETTPSTKAGDGTKPYLESANLQANQEGFDDAI